MSNYEYDSYLLIVLNTVIPLVPRKGNVSYFILLILLNKLFKFTVIPRFTLQLLLENKKTN